MAQNHHLRRREKAAHDESWLHYDKKHSRSFSPQERYEE
jgi:hypothetical protein